MNGETLQNSLQNAKEQSERCQKALQLISEIQTLFVGPRVDKIDSNTLNTTNLLRKLLRDDAAQAEKYIKSIQAEITKRRLNVA